MKEFDIKEMTRKHGKGFIGTSMGALGRYSEFPERKYKLQLTEGSRFGVSTSVNIAFNKNSLCSAALKGGFDWLLILDDDHCFDDDMVMQLLDCEVDIIHPFNLRRTPPYAPVINGTKEEGFRAYDWDYVKGKSGIIEVPTCGGNGMLVRRDVLAHMAGDWHCGHAPDLWFCHRARQLNYKIYINMDIPIGHITHMAAWGVMGSDGEYKVKILPANALPGGIDDEFFVMDDVRADEGLLIIN